MCCTHLRRLDPATGVLTRIGSTSFDFLGSMQFSPAFRTLYAISVALTCTVALRASYVVVQRAIVQGNWSLARFTLLWQTVQKVANVCSEALAQIQSTAVKEPIEVCVQSRLGVTPCLKGPHHYSHTAHDRMSMAFQTSAQLEVICQHNRRRTPRWRTAKRPTKPPQR